MLQDTLRRNGQVPMRGRRVQHQGQRHQLPLHRERRGRQKGRGGWRELHARQLRLEDPGRRGGHHREAG